MSPAPEWKCLKRFKLGLGKPWESNDSDTDTEEVVLRKEIRVMQKRENFNDGTKQQRMN